MQRLEAADRKSLRVRYFGRDVALDRETMAWLNVQEVPVAAAADHRMQIAKRIRIKAFLRPQALKQLAAAPDKLIWSVVAGKDG